MSLQGETNEFNKRGRSVSTSDSVKRPRQNPAPPTPLTSASRTPASLTPAPPPSAPPDPRNPFAGMTWLLPSSSTTTPTAKPPTKPIATTPTAAKRPVKPPAKPPTIPTVKKLPAKSGTTVTPSSGSGPSPRPPTPKPPAPTTTASAPATMGGADPIIIKPTVQATSRGRAGSAPTPPTRPDIALLTYEAQSPDEMRSDYLYQALQKMRDNSIFTGLLDTVTSKAPDDWSTLAAGQLSLPDSARLMEEDVLDRLARVPKSVGIVVVDGAGFPELSAERDSGGPLAFYNSDLHLIQHAQLEDTDDVPIPLSQGGGYWKYLRDVTFEMCNASQRDTMQGIDQAAKAGDLDCVSFTLAKETLETTSETMHDDLIRKALASRDMRTVVDEDATTTSELPVPERDSILYSPTGSGSRSDRLRGAVQDGHAESLIAVWKQEYAGPYKAKNPRKFAAFDAWTKGTGPKPTGIDHADTVRRLTGQRVTSPDVGVIEADTRKRYSGLTVTAPVSTEATGTPHTTVSGGGGSSGGSPAAKTAKPKKTSKSVKKTKPKTPRSSSSTSTGNKHAIT
ncbi:hypothetical protein JOL79_23535 [Microbispora sp. RL4-1S]|uniref:Uncharacterized protein n=1 Tax=Microbispora oryzae TaxID=2806554 RepID=A0A941ARW6_9ACTN|nr:hypothetical protein [Microbispora oryzae]MBP2706784.1 hypothetical protein [Microbispora oryzae]